MKARLLASATFALVLVAATSVGCKRKDSAASGSGDNAAGSEHAGGGSGAADEPAKKASTAPGCALPEGDITTNVTIAKGCKLVVSEWINVKGRGSLTIEPGAQIAFGAGGGIWVEEGRVVAKGLPNAPITFTSASAKPAPGDWEGIVFGENLSAGNELDRVVVEYAGKANGHCDGAVCLSHDTSDNRLSVTSSTLQNNGAYGFASRSSHTMAKFEKNTLKNNKAGSINVTAQTFGSFGENTWGGPVHVHGDVSSSIRWPKVDVPVMVDLPIHVHGEKSAAILTLADKTTLKFGAETFLTVGSQGGGGLVAKEAVFTSANTPPHEGDWSGIVLYGNAVSTSLDGCVVEYAGREGATGTHAAITFQDKGPKELKSVKIAKTTFRHNTGSAIATHGEDCGDLASAANGNKSEGAALCAK